MVDYAQMCEAYAVLLGSEPIYHTSKYVLLYPYRFASNLSTTFPWLHIW